MKHEAQHPTDEESQELAISRFRGIDVGLGKADPLASAAAKLTDQYPQHLVMIQAGKFLGLGAIFASRLVSNIGPLAKVAHIAYSAVKERRNSERSGDHTRQIVVFLRPCQFNGREDGGYKRPERGNPPADCVRFLPSRPPCGLRVETHLHGHIDLTQERFMNSKSIGALAPSSSLSSSTDKSHVAIDLGTIPASELELPRHELIALCQEIEFIRAWYEHYQDDLRSKNRKCASEVHDVIIGSVLSARSIARTLGVTLDRYENEEFGVERARETTSEFTDSEGV